MDYRQLLRLSAQEARTLAKLIEGAKEVSDDGSVESSKSDFYERVKERADGLFQEAVDKRLLEDRIHGVNDGRVVSEIVGMLSRAKKKNLSSLEINLLNQLLACVPHHVKKSGKSIKIKDDEILLTINTGKREYKFVFPKRNFTGF